MAKINIKQPKYIIPLVMLPFLLIMGYAISVIGNKKNDDAGLVTKEEMNTELQNPINPGTETKIEALRNTFKKEGDFSGIQNVEKEYDDMTENAGSLYSTDEMIYIDSINQLSRIKEEEIKKMTERYTSKDYTQGDSLKAELAGVNVGGTKTTSPKYGAQQDSTFEQKRDAAYQKQMARIYKQMRSIDSLKEIATQQEMITKANKSTETQNNAETSQTQEIGNGKTSLVRKTNTAIAFNTLSSDESGDGIVAMLDETVTVRGSSRIRIRLLEDVAVDNVTLKKGDYVYGLVSGITGQRVTISVKSIMVKGKIYNTDLVVYDNDGMEGFFIPDNYFREMAKEIGSNTVSQTNFTIENGTETWQSLVYKTLNNVIRQLTTSIGKTIKQPKATLKYNTQIYLYNNNDK